MNKALLLMSLSFVSLGMQAQKFKVSYITNGVTSEKFHLTVQNWENNKRVNEDDNFYISRVKPKVRFRNSATQVKQTITAADDKRLMMWVPYDEPEKNALPDGVFDSEVFSMWNYIDHWGDWSAPLGRVPGSLLDVAHKNGVAVSSVAGIPNRSITTEYSNMLLGLASIGGDRVAKYLTYYGLDGLGYNSEFSSGYTVVRRLQPFHEALYKKMRETNPVFENMWYDGTNNSGNISFDGGLGPHNNNNFGSNGHERASLFFNYNWTSSSYLSSIVSYARNTMQRDPLYLYMGINMQGGEPRYVNDGRWTLLQNYPLSIGLWGAHTRNMFWESRNEKGSEADVKQRTYMLRTERWFTGGTRNPVTCPAVGNSLQYHADNFTFQGMSPFMSAKSTLKWDLSEEPFITYFNLGNGKFFNWQGKRQHNREWANVGVQDYLPTWRWWFTTGLMGRTASDVPASGLDAEFTWDDAYMGGSTVRIFGSVAQEYLHLFKTGFELKAGDVITVRYKVNSGTSDVKLVLTAVNDETTEHQYALRESAALPDADEWVEKTFTVGADFNNKELALVALRFDNAANLDMNLGEFSIVRGAADTPAQPEITSHKLLAYNASGLDAKLIFKMASSKAADEPVYNQDVKTSLFKIWAQQENKEPVLMGVTTSWAAMIYSAPMDVAVENTKVRIGVSAVSLDMKSESPVAWTAYEATPAYVYNNEIQLDKIVIKPNEAFTLSFVDPKHAAAQWELKDGNGATVLNETGQSVTATSGLAAKGIYNLTVTDPVTNAKTEYPGYVQITDEAQGALPVVNTLTANGGTSTVNVSVNDKVTMAYTGRASDGTLSRGLQIEEGGVGFKTNAAGFTSDFRKEWTLSFWIKFNKIQGTTQFVDLRDQDHAGWPQNNWGSFWSTYDPNSKELTFTIRASRSGGTEHQSFWGVNFIPGLWTHVAIAMEKNSTGIREKIYINGKLATPKRWVQSSGGTAVSSGTGMNPNFQHPGAYWADNNTSFMMIGKGRHQTAAIDGVVDDVKFFDHELTEAQVAATMNTQDASDSPYLFWNFEQEPASNLIASTTANAVDFMAIGSVAGATEGQQLLGARVPHFDAGSFFSAGTSYALQTKPIWRANKGSVTEATGNSTAGSAKVSYPIAGDYAVTLTLENSFGSDSKTFSVIKVGASTGINGAATADSELKAYTVGEDIYVECAEDGNYNFDVYAVDGSRVLSQNLKVAVGNTVKLHLANTGIYILKVRKDGKTLRAVKLVRK